MASVATSLEAAPGTRTVAAPAHRIASVDILVAETDGVEVTFGALEPEGNDIGFALQITGPATVHELRVEA